MEKTPVNARSILLPYALSLVGAMLLIQIVIAATGSAVTVLAGALTALVAIGIAVWLRRNRHRLAHVRFGTVIAHTIAYVIITTSFNLHAVVLIMTMGLQGASLDAFAYLAFSTSWFGATVVMSALWGLGLLTHLIGAVLGRGWED